MNVATQARQIKNLIGEAPQRITLIDFTVIKNLESMPDISIFQKKIHKNELLVAKVLCDVEGNVMLQ
jgi:hypothetical protein